MCLAVPGRILRILDETPLFRRGEVEFLGIRRDCSLACVPEAREGDFVIVHAGVAITVIDEVAAQQTLADLAAADHPAVPLPNALPASEPRDASSR
jgi:hydrogenase expression/formation protein HypC